MCPTEKVISVSDKQDSATAISGVRVEVANNVFQFHGADYRNNRG